MEKSKNLSQDKQKILQQLLKGNKANIGDVIQKRSNSNFSPLSFAQRRLWFLEQLVPGTPMYNMPAVIRLEGELNIAALEYCLQQIIQRHEVLRTNLIVQDGQPVQVIKKESQEKLIKISLSDFETEEQQVEVNRLIDKEIKRPFDLVQDSLIRATLVTLKEGSYLLIVVMHHIVSDGWSLGVFAKDFMKFYLHYMNGEAYSDELQIQYADFAQWQIEKFNNNGYEKQSEYWKNVLSGELPVLQLPVKKTNQAILTYEGARHTFHLEKELIGKLKHIAKETGCTLYMVLLAAYNVLLYRYTNQEDIIVGTPVANRQNKNIENLIGFFVNTLAIRTDLKNQPTFKELLARIKKATVGAFSNQDLPFEILVEQIQPKRVESQTPIFQTMFVLQNTPYEKIQIPNLTLEFLETDNGTAKFDLLLTTMETDDGLVAAFEFNTARFDLEMIKNMAAHFNNILARAVAEPDLGINQIAFLTDEESKWLLSGEECSIENKQNGESLITIFKRMAQKYPKRLAVSYRDESITYAELNEQTNQLCKYLKKQGVKKGDFVGLCTERSIDMIVSMVSILKCGAAYLPLDPYYPQDRLSMMMEDSQIKTVIVTDLSTGIIKTDHLNTININQLAEDIRKEDPSDISEEVNSKDLAYILYTSGSTGRPKGVLVEHANVVRLFTSTNEKYKFNHQDVWTLFHSYAFDFSVWEIWGALLYGGHLVVVPYETSRSADEFLELLIQEKVTILNQTPSAYKQLLQVPSIFSEETREALKLKYIIFGGEALDLQVLKPWFQFYGDQKPRLVNMYGITETTVHVTYRPLSEKDVNENKGSLIGNPIKDLYVYVLDQHLQPVPTGVPGELYVGGGGVTRGYWKREDITNERFIQDPLGRSANKIYRTGDLVRRTFSGELEYLGRIDNQVKIRGFRIELGEIEALINKRPEIKEGIVSVYEHNEDKRLVGYLILDSDYKKSMLEKLQLNEQQVNEWEEVFDDYYTQQAKQEDPTFNIIGWNSTYTKEPIPREEMKVWLESTVNKIITLKPRRVLEIGIGTGMILYRVAPHSESYIGTDLSRSAIQYTSRQLAELPQDYSHVQVIQQVAHQLDKVENQSVDTVILNSIIQYFPSEEYLTGIIDEVLKKLNGNGKIFIGDVRDYELLEHFYISLEMSLSEEGKTVSEARNNIETRFLKESELVLSYAYFLDLLKKFPQISNVQFTPKRGRTDNELTKFRYDVVLTVGNEGCEDIEKPIPISQLNWDERKLTIDEIKKYIKSEQKENILIRNIINTRVEKEMKALKLIEISNPNDTLRQIEEQINLTEGIHPEELWQIADELGMKLELSINHYHNGLMGYYHALFYKDEKVLNGLLRELVPLTESRKKEVKATTPLQIKLESKIIANIRDYLEENLPNFMVPSNFVVIEKIPLTANGKADLKALPRPFANHMPPTALEQAPTTKLQKELVDIWKDILGLKEIGVKDNFFDIGGHSLLATQLILKVRQTYHVKLPLRVLFEKPSITEMALVIEEYLLDKKECENRVLNKNLSDEVQLDIDLKVKDPFIAKEAKSIFLTGATGFFGAFLLHDLLMNTDSDIYCLVRAKTRLEAMERIKANLAQYGQYIENVLHRVKPVVGDLAKPYLGMDSKTFEQLTGIIDSIIHNGAHVNFIYPYESLKDANVGGTKEIIRLASRKRIKPIHFISTLYVFAPTSNQNEVKYINESTPLESSEGLRMGYTQSKWVAEKILNIAKEKGIPVNIYRLGRVSGHSITGACQVNDFFWSMLKGCIEVEKYPNENITFEMSPVDYLSKAIVQIIKKQNLNKTFHLFNKNPLELSFVTAAISELGYDLSEVTNEDWLHALTTQENAAMPFAQLIADGMFEGAKLVFDNANVVEEIENFNSINISKQMIQAIITYFVQTGYLKEPVLVERG